MNPRRWTVHKLENQRQNLKKYISKEESLIEDVFREATMERPAHALMCAMLEQAIKDVQECGIHKEDAICWLKVNEPIRPFSSSWICFELNINKKRLIEFAERKDIAHATNERKRLRADRNKDREGRGGKKQDVRKFVPKVSEDPGGPVPQRCETGDVPTYAPDSQDT